MFAVVLVQGLSKRLILLETYLDSHPRHVRRSFATLRDLSIAE